METNVDVCENYHLCYQPSTMISVMSVERNCSCLGPIYDKNCDVDGLFRDQPRTM